MRMKSVLALSALSAATFLAGAVYAADAQTGKQTVQSSQPVVKTVTKTQTQTNAVQPAPVVKAAQPVQAVQPAPAVQAAPPEEAVKTEHKKHHARHKHHRKHHHHRHHRHHHHHHHHGYEYAEVPTWNFLVGGSLGYTSQKERFTTRFVSNALIPVAAGASLSPFQYRDHSEDMTDEGILMSLLAGWQWHCHRWMLGAEANVDFGDYALNRDFAYTDPFTFQAIEGTMLYDRGNVYALTGRAGYFVTPAFMPYVRLGAQISRDEVSYQAFINTPVGAVPDYSSTKKDIWGIVAGIGAEFPTYIGSSTIRFEYNFVRTESIAIQDTAFPIIGTHKYRYPQSNIGKVAFVWNFM